VRTSWWADGLADLMHVMRTQRMTNRTSRLLGGVAVAVLVLSAAACGGGGGSNTTTSTAAGGTSAEQWANGVCSSFTAWQKSLESIKTGVTSQPSA
jgi:hypothetical protein